jgi:hypothetical protein
MTMIDPDVKVISSAEFIKVYSSSMFKLKTLIDNGEIKATKRNGRYIIDLDSVKRWHSALFGEDEAA